MSINNIFPPTLLTPPEIGIISEVFTNPVVKKYLHSLAVEDTKELLALAAMNKTQTEIATAHAIVQGKLSVISTLLSISKE